MHDGQPRSGDIISTHFAASNTNFFHPILPGVNKPRRGDVITLSIVSTKQFLILPSNSLRCSNSAPASQENSWVIKLSVRINPEGHNRQAKNSV